MSLKPAQRGKRFTEMCRRHRTYLVIGAIAFGLRLSWVLYAAREPTFLGDPYIYRGYGKAFSAGFGYVNGFNAEPTAYFPPGYPAFVGAITAIEERLPSPSLPSLLGLAQAALGTLTIVLVMSIARRWWGTKAGIAAGLILALSPNLIVHSSLFLSETLHVFTLAVCAFCAVAAAQHSTGTNNPVDGNSPVDENGPDAGAYTALTSRIPVRVYVLGCGLALGASVLIRPQGGIIALPIAAYWWFSDGTFRHRFGPIAAIAALSLAIVVPWSVRNLVVMDSFVAVSTNVGDNLCIGNGPNAYGGFRLAPDCQVEHQTQDGTEDEVLHNQETAAIARERILSDPLGALSLTPRRFGETVSNDHDGTFAATEFGRSDWMPPALETTLNALSDLWWFALAGSALLAVPVFRLWSNRQGLFLIGCAIAGFAAPLMTFGHPRFKIPALIFLALIASRWAVESQTAEELDAPEIEPTVTR